MKEIFNQPWQQSIFQQEPWLMTTEDGRLRLFRELPEQTGLLLEYGESSLGWLPYREFSSTQWGCNTVTRQTEDGACLIPVDRMDQEIFFPERRRYLIGKTPEEDRELTVNDCEILRFLSGRRYLCIDGSGRVVCKTIDGDTVWETDIVGVAEHDLEWETQGENIIIRVCPREMLYIYDMGGTEKYRFRIAGLTYCSYSIDKDRVIVYGFDAKRIPPTYKKIVARQNEAEIDKLCELPGLYFERFEPGEKHGLLLGIAEKAGKCGTICWLTDLESFERKEMFFRKSNNPPGGELLWVDRERFLYYETRGGKTELALYHISGKKIGTLVLSGWVHRCGIECHEGCLHAVLWSKGKDKNSSDYRLVMIDLEL